MDAVSGVNYFNGNFYSTQVVDNSDGTFSSTLFRTDAQGNNAVPIAGYGAAAGAQVINTTNATAAEQQLLADPNSVLNQIRQQQAQSLEGDFFPTAATPDQQTALAQAAGGSGNTASATGTPDQQGGSTPTSPPPQNQSSGGGFLIYPLKMGGTQQDRIKFTAVAYQPSGNLAAGTLSSQNRTSSSGKSIIGTVFLPIQASISDLNSVEWQGGSINEIQKQAVNLSLGAMNAGQLDSAGLTKKLGAEYARVTSEAAKASNEIKVFLAQEAVGVQNLLGRFGTVLNPNLELLFSGPQLRPFDFKFQMSAREKAEGENIKKIINFFKKNMAVKKSDGAGIFLKAPNTFMIEYKFNGGSTTHPGINQIKECALLSCSVEYTPLGTYMTYPDGTMVSYSMSLSFQELEPLYDKDYDGHPIGY